MSGLELSRWNVLSGGEGRRVLALALGGGSLAGCLILYHPALGGILLLLPLAAILIADPRRFLPAGLIFLAVETVILKYAPAPLTIPIRYAVESATVALALLTVAGKALRGEVPRRTPIDLPLLCFLATVAVSAAINHVPGVVAAAGVKNLLRFVFLFYLAVQLDFFPRDLRRLLTVLFAVAAAETLFCLFQPILGVRLLDFLRPGEVMVGGILLRAGEVVEQTPFSKAFGTMGRYNYLGNYLAFALCLGIAPVALGARTRTRFALLAFLGLGLFLTSSRMSILGLGLGVAWMFLRGQKRWPLLLLFGLVLALALEFSRVRLLDFAGGETGASARDRFFVIFTPEYKEQSTRWYTLTTILPALLQHSPLLGLGSGTIASDALSIFPEQDRSRELGIAPYFITWLPDVGVAAMIGQFGLLGTACLGWILLRLFRLASRLVKQSPRPEVRALGLGVAGIILVMAFINLPGYAFNYRVPAYTFWLMTGVMARLAQAEEGDRCESS